MKKNSNLLKFSPKFSGTEPNIEYGTLKSASSLLAQDGLTASLVSDETVKIWSQDPVKKPETINYKTFKPERMGAFSLLKFSGTESNIEYGTLKSASSLLEQDDLIASLVSDETVKIWSQQDTPETIKEREGAFIYNKM